MKGMELALRYWQEEGRPALERECPQLPDRAAVGLVGEGSECFGYDDALSRDHDWGPGFCLWLTREDMELWGDRARQVYAALPTEFLGFRRLRQGPMSAGRVGVLEIGAFYRTFLGMERPPATLHEWRCMSEAGLATATNGRVFQDPTGAFTAVREALLAYYPEDLRRKKLAARCAMAAQSGQYNYLRCLRRGEEVAAFAALAQFVDHAQAILFLLNRRYRPYYKWAQRELRTLPVLGAEAADLLDALVREGTLREERIETLCGRIIGELKRQDLTDSGSDFLLPHGEAVQRRIEDPGLRALHLMAE